MSIASALKKALKAGYYVASCNALEYAATEREALKIVDTLDKMGRDAAVYRYRDGVFRRCMVVDLGNLFPEQQQYPKVTYPVPSGPAR